MSTWQAGELTITATQEGMLVRIGDREQYLGIDELRRLARWLVEEASKRE